MKKKPGPKPMPRASLFTETKAVAFTKTEMRALRLAAIKKNMNLTKYMRAKLMKGLTT